jgi:short-subunit dehydrogenase
MDWVGKRYWLVGASEGLGADLAKIMAAAGVDLVLSARNEARLGEVAASLPRRAEIVPCDVSDMDSVRRAAQATGEIDGVVYLAGLYWPMSAGQTDTDKAVQMCDVNLTGAMRVIGTVLPAMVARDHGHVVITGSLAGFRGLPGAVGYAASKAGVMSLAESLYADLRGSGVRVQLANPGFIRTRLTAQNQFNMPSIMEPEAAAREMFEHMTAGGFKKSFPLGFSLLFRIGQILPDALWYRMFPRR